MTLWTVPMDSLVARAMVRMDSPSVWRARTMRRLSESTTLADRPSGVGAGLAIGAGLLAVAAGAAVLHDHLTREQAPTPG